GAPPPPPHPVHPLTMRSPLESMDQLAEVIVTVSLASPMVMVSASVLVPMVIVSQAAELQRDREVAVLFPIVRAPAEPTSIPCPAATVTPPVSALRESALRASWTSTLPPALMVRVAPSEVILSPLTARVPVNVKPVN